MRFTLILALALLCGFSSALVVGPVIYEQRDFGNLNEHQFTYSLSADCNASVITAIIYNETNNPVQGATVLLSYIDFAQPLLANVLTDKDGVAVLKLPGQVQLMRGLFIMVVQKNGFKDKEVHFDLYPCYHNGQLPPKPQPPKQNATPPPAPPPVQNSTPPAEAPPANNGSGSSPPPPDQSSNESGTSAPGGIDGICPASLILPSLMFFKTRKR